MNDISASVIAPDADETGFVSRFVTASDGLRLHVRAYGRRGGRELPIVCLPGLTRNGADFHELATSLTRDEKHPRLAIAVDSRGRGLSDHDPNPDNYSFPVELADLMAVLTALEIGPAIFIGTSRGGILTMLLGAARPAAIAGVILNDVGPVIDTKGLVRIKGYVGKLPNSTQLSGGRGDFAPAGRCAVSGAVSGKLAPSGEANLAAGERQAGARLRSEAFQNS